MANRLGYVLLLTALTGSVLVTACGDDDAIGGGEAGEPGVSGSPGDAGSGGSGGSGISGSSVGGQGASAGEAGAVNAGGVGGESGGSGGVAGSGDTGSAGEAGAPMGDGGTGGAADPGLVYACGTTTILHTFCSAAASLNCANTPDCASCVMIAKASRDPLAGCATCVALYDESLQCGIDAFESGNATEGLECFEGDGVYLTPACDGAQFEAIACDEYFSVNKTCPAKWPLD
ncbi:MAG: hypothetical protein K0R38_7181 [Polyangiaceae bacterium]|jgi:hypothetical protein|nr:hypothetical protein [Polyangiaceae bacterium]